MSTLMAIILSEISKSHPLNIISTRIVGFMCLRPMLPVNITLPTLKKITISMSYYNIRGSIILDPMKYVKVHDIFIKLVAFVYREFMPNFVFHLYICFVFHIWSNFVFVLSSYTTGAICGAGNIYPTTPGLTLGSVHLTMFCSIVCCNLVCPYVCSFNYFFWFMYFFLRLIELAGCWIKISHIVLFYYVHKTKAKSYLHTTVTVRTDKTTNVKQT